MATDQEFQSTYASLTGRHADELTFDPAFRRMLAAWHAAGCPQNISGFIASCLRLSLFTEIV